MMFFRSLCNIAFALVFFFLAACGGLSSDSDPAAAEATVSSDAADVGYDAGDVDNDGRPDGQEDPLLMVQGGVLQSDEAALPASPFMCADESIRQYTAISVLAGYGLGGDDDWYAESDEAYRLMIDDREYDCARLFDNEDVFRGAERSSSSDCDADTDPDEDGFQCWINLTDNARGDAYVAKTTYVDENGEEVSAWNAFWTEVNGVLYTAVSSSGSTGENQVGVIHRVGNLPLLVDVPADHEAAVAAVAERYGFTVE